MQLVDGVMGRASLHACTNIGNLVAMERKAWKADQGWRWLEWHHRWADAPERGLHASACKGDVDDIKRRLLLGDHFDEPCPSSGLTPLQIASRAGRACAVALLASIPSHDSWLAAVAQHPPALQLAAQGGHLATVRALLDASKAWLAAAKQREEVPGARADGGRLRSVAEVWQGSCALHVAAASDCPEIVRALLDAGFDLAEQDAHGLSPLDYGIIGGAVGVLSLLRTVAVTR